MAAILQETSGAVQRIVERRREQRTASQEIAHLVENIAQAAQGSSSWAVQNAERAQNLQRLSAELRRNFLALPPDSMVSG